MWILDFLFFIFDYGFWILDLLKGIMDFDVKLKVDVDWIEVGLTWYELDGVTKPKNPMWKKKKKWRRPYQTQRERKKKKKEEEEEDHPNSSNLVKKKKKKGRVKSCGCCSDHRSLYVCLIIKIPLETENTMGP